MFMSNIDFSIFGSTTFSSILHELEFNKILNFNSLLKFKDKKIIVKILFVDNLKVKEVKNYLLQNEPIILFLNHKNYLKDNDLKLLDFHVNLELPIEILSLKEILNILITKYSFFKKSKIMVNNYEIDSNERSISKQKVKVKLTEKELELILALNDNNGLNKSFLLKNIWKHSLDLETHAFETHLHRLRKKINKYFKDKNFIIEKNSLYYLSS
jgi:DNA-binding response OmpR family regulator